jgi:hypothetical protein
MGIVKDLFEIIKKFIIFIINIFLFIWSIPIFKIIIIGCCILFGFIYLIETFTS